MPCHKMYYLFQSVVSPTTMPLFTCISCRVVFANSELQKAHYRTDWHRYNLKRKVADLPPVTAVDFQQRVLERKAQVSLLSCV